MNSVIIRALDPSEWAVFRDLRLEALRAAPGFFVTSYDEALVRTPEEWQNTIKGPAHQVFGLFDGEHLIGITAAFTWREDPSGKTGILAMSFILPEYRGRCLSRLLYEARLDWIRTNPHFKRVVVSHRLSNEVARRAIRRYGFQPTGRTSRTWPDEVIEDEVWYELPISN